LCRLHHVRLRTTSRGVETMTRRHHVPRSLQVPGILVVLLLGGSGPATAQDIITSKSGDRLVGEIKRLEKDVLTVETPYSDSDFNIEWGDVVSIESTRQFIVETFSGQRLTGALTPRAGQAGTIDVTGTAVTLAEISALQPFERSFWSRFDTSMDFGYSMVRANSAKQLNLGGTLSYRDQRSVDATHGGGRSAMTTDICSASAGTSTRHRIS
jgi:hypothetical protein